MDPLKFDVSTFLSVHYILILILTVITASIIAAKDEPFYKGSQRNRNIQVFLSLILTLFLTFFWGLRGHSGFGDTGYYIYSYENLYDDYITPTLNNEWLWNNISHFMKLAGVSSTSYLIIIEGLYIGSMLICCFRLMRNNVWVAMLFFIGSFSFIGYGVNGIRNGLSCSILLIAISFSSEDKTIFKILGIVLMVICTGIHASTIVPSICCILAMFLLKDLKIAILFWVFSIFLSLIAGDTISTIFAGLGFDDRASRYLVDAEESEASEMFSRTGFRWDFLIYSMVPIILAWYLKIKRNFIDRKYDIIAITYILANSFWIMVIRATYSNRFAYLSWFMYPLLIAYPLLRFNIWENQNKKISIALIIYFGFTYFMHIIGK